MSLQATGALGEQRKLKDNLEQTQAELKTKSNQVRKMCEIKLND